MLWDWLNSKKGGFIDVCVCVCVCDTIASLLTEGDITVKGNLRDEDKNTAYTMKVFSSSVYFLIAIDCIVWNMMP